MKIIVKSQEAKNINITLPTGLIFNRITLSIALRALNKEMPKNNIRLKQKDKRQIIKLLRRMRRKHPNLELVNVESSDGDIVKVKW